MDLKPNCELLDYYESLETFLEYSKTKEVCLMSHNVDWPIAEILNEKYNCNITTHGSSTSYLRHFEFNGIHDYDLLFLASNKVFDEYEIPELLDIALNISRKNNKKVTFGYSFFIPYKERTDGISYKMIAKTVNNDRILDDDTFITSVPLKMNPIIPCLSLISRIHNQKGKVKKYKIDTN